jgi:uncharacterized protein (DUF2344 family)
MLLICDKNAKILYLGKLYCGSDVDWSIFKKELLAFNFEQLRVWVDLGFIGIEKVLENGDIFIPHKKKKKAKLSEFQKFENQQLARQRVVVEHAIGGMKRYYILRYENRMKRPHQNPKLDLATEICAALWNFRRSFKVKPQFYEIKHI